MFKTAKKTKQPSTVAAAPLDIPTIQRRMDELRARDRTLILETAELVKPGASTGSAARFEAIRQERAEIERDLEALNVQLSEAAMQRAKREMERRGSEWRQLLHETAMTACRLQALNRRRVQMAREIRGKAGFFALPGEFRNRDAVLLGLGLTQTGEVDEFLREMVRLGITTEGEIARERGDAAEGF